MAPTKDILSALEQSLADNSFVKLSLGNYKGPEHDLKNIYVRRITVKREEKLSFTYRFKTKDIVKNFDTAEALKKLQKELNHGFGAATLFTTEFDLVLEKGAVKKSPPTTKQAPSLSHDKPKSRVVETAGKFYLFALNITDDKGTVLKNANDKYRQIDKYVEILGGLIKNIPSGNFKKIIDMGAGKGYLTFALYDHITNTLGQKVKVTGVEMRPDLVKLCNGIARDSNFTDLNFTEGTIENYDASGANVLIALHACDTATDDAIHKGIEAGAELIVVAPCCHKQIRREIESTKKSNDLDFVMKHGIFIERQAEMVTDGLRALILEYFGYNTKVFEFVGGEHTAKNIMIVAEKTSRAKNPALLKKIKDTKDYFGIKTHYLEKLLKI